jgi:hypothetical protein
MEQCRAESRTAIRWANELESQLALHTLWRDDHSGGTKSRRDHGDSDLLFQSRMDDGAKNDVAVGCAGRCDS